MSTLKRTLSVLLAALMLTQIVACNNTGTPETSTTTAATTTEDPLKDTHPGLAALTDEDKATYLALAAQNADRAHIIGSTIEKYYVDGRGNNLTFYMYLNTNTMKPHDTASVWHISSVLSMTSKLWSINAGGKGSSYASFYGKILDEMEYYKGTGFVTTYNKQIEQTMYAVNPSGTKGGASLAGVAAVYDDQMWIIRELIYAYQLTGDEAYMEQALALTQVCLDAWDTTVINGKELGGIDWGPGYDSKHTCSNAPLIQPLVELYEIFRDEGRENAEYYLEWAKKVYDFTKDNLMLTNGLYGDLVRPQGGRKEEGLGRNKHWVTQGPLGSLDSTTYSYNTGAMISGAACLYRATGEESYLKDAKKSAASAYRQFTVTKKIDGETLRQYQSNPKGMYASNTWFNLILLEGFIDLYPYDTKCKTYIDAFQTSLDYGFDNFRTEEGLMPRDLLSGWNQKQSPDSSKDIMDTASTAEMYAALAEFYTKIAS
ncbi:MAG: hypothetical protein J6R82_01480 [Clostridia bacterium]|nr:hypothetical protein [Clostridia bacterium]